MPGTPLTRTEYLNLSTGTPRSGSTAHGESLIDVENYLLPMERLRGAGLHTWGVGDGLRVTAVAGQPAVTVSTGLALDLQGRTVALVDGGLAIVDPGVDPNQVQNIPTVPVTAAGVELSTAGLTGDCFVTLTWREVLDSNQLPNTSTLVHAPWLQLIAAAGFADDGLRVVLARVALDPAGAVTAATGDARRLAGVPVGGVQLRRVRSGPGLAVDQEPGAELAIRADGRVDLTVLAPAASTLLSIGAPGEGGGLDVARRMRVRQGGDASAGIWLWQDDHQADRGFVGMTATQQLGFFGPGAGWGLVMDVDNGHVGIGGSLAIGTSGRADLRVSGDAMVGAGSNGGLTVRHLNGKSSVTDDFDDLYLNYAVSKDVHVGGGTPSTLRVHGVLSVDGSAHIAGGNLDLRGLPNGIQLDSPGRFHISGRERLYLLNQDGVIVGTEWGGTGNLTVEGHQLQVGSVGLPAWSGGGVVSFDLFATGGLYVGGDPANPTCRFYADGTKHFVIDHPLDPENRLLTHACIEGPEAGVYYRGVGRLADGIARVELPGYFEALTRPDGRTVMLTAICEPDEPITVLAASAVTGGGFVVRAADDRNPGQRFCWEVKAARADVPELTVETDRVRSA